MDHGRITQYLSQLLEQEFEFGVNDCHIMAFTVVDLILGNTNYRDELVGKYKTAKAGFRLLAKKGTFKNIVHLCQELCDEVDHPMEGDILVDVDGFHCSIYWMGKYLVLNQEKNKYQITKYSTDCEYKIYRIRKS
ncbi:Uncharacterised protein [Yersinia pekkanenii]|uniref:DUF6950 domain-containing protein n=1 Tax=Yersinia pekkanenii TaxID=1288385 RepID=A0A0T9PT37_9GAMM|nr:hypothetical protein [Yersinia pekkanenii]CNH80713.1 Uncharacterised protein [Yersinia pekkanenii]